MMHTLSTTTKRTKGETGNDKTRNVTTKNVTEKRMTGGLEWVVTNVKA
jgi:hypothetical protein